MPFQESDDEETKEIRKLAAQIREKKAIRLAESHLRRKVRLWDFEGQKVPNVCIIYNRGSQPGVHVPLWV